MDDQRGPRARCPDVLSRIGAATPVEPHPWSASRYVWHTVDVLETGYEALAGQCVRNTPSSVGTSSQ